MVAAFPQAAAATSSTDKTPNLTRPPLLPSGKDQHQNNGSTHIATKKPRGRQVPSRYLSPSPSPSTTTTTTTTTTSSSFLPKRLPSPLLSRSTNSGPLHTPSTTASPFLSGSKRSQSVDRRRPVTSSRETTPNPQGNAEMSAATKMLITSTRSLSVSFQGEAFSLPISKAKSVTPPQNIVSRKATPERRRATPVGDQGENSRPMDHHRWPGRSREGNLKERNQLLSRSLDCSVVVGGGGDKRVVGSGFMGVKSLQQSMMVDEGRRLSLDLGNIAKHNPDSISVTESSFTGDLTASDSESVSSGSTSGVTEIGKWKTGARGIAASARFWQETNSRLRRLQDPGSPLSTSPGSRMGVSPKAIQSKRFSSDGPLASPRMMAASPVRGATRSASPSKLWTSTSPSKGMSSPSRVIPMSSSTPSILSFSVDLRRGKMGENRIVDAHMLRLLYNRYLQWRFVNARADTTFMVQRLSAEKNLWNAWVTVSELRHSVTLRRIKLLLLRQKLKLTSILKGQIAHLEEWSLLDRGHSSSLEGATEALKASTLRLPVVGKAVANIQNLKDVVGSAVDVMQAMASSICSLSSKVTHSCNHSYI
ncbi:AUGMIN FAMILY MEMBER [Salix purpurea]|uniref:AUGMIN FAMILY MEMBER n=1 Tax=Salix purpurea TaxID=77065 RepID=A0A9Q0VTT0_SALPP|nr:AUGMIN FAMILY MEMBER [Salix purpurea]KAJ6754834.1 AUGMIN FAMILY MEMBER [Salix purpurea]